MNVVCPCNKTWGIGLPFDHPIWKQIGEEMARCARNNHGVGWGTGGPIRNDWAIWDMPQPTITEPKFTVTISNHTVWVDNDGTE